MPGADVTGFGPPARAAIVWLALPALLAAPGGAALDAQIPGASARALGLMDNYTALAHAHEAVAWNPAALGFAESGAASAAFLAIHAGGGIGPVGLDDLRAVEGGVLSGARKRDWLRRIRSAGSQSGSVVLDVTYMAGRLGRLGWQLSTGVDARIDMSADAAELVLFGNAGYSGDTRDFSLKGASVDARATSTLAVSYAHPVPLRVTRADDERLAIGATLKYTVGHLLVTGEDRGSTLESDPLRLTLEFPVAHTDEGPWGNGAGVGLDAGVGWRLDGWAVALVMRNIFHTFAWDARRLRFRPGRALVGIGGGEVDFRARPLNRGPGELRRRVERLGYARRAIVGVAARPRPDLTVTADIRRRFGEPAGFSPRTHIGLGVEYRRIPRLPVRAGIATVSGGYRIGGGVGIEAGRVRASIAVARYTDEPTEPTMASLSVSVRR